MIKSRLFLIFLLCVITTTGCSKTSLIYEHPSAPTNLATNLEIEIMPSKDQRVPNEDVDKMWKDKPTEYIELVAQEELYSTGLFQNVYSSGQSAENKQPNIEKLLLLLQLNELEWEIPNHKQQEDTAMAVSILTGGLGGLIYGSGETEFYGKAKINVLLSDNKSGRVFINKEYIAVEKDKMARLSTDSYEERSKIIGKAVKKIMQELKGDVLSAFANDRQ